MILLTSCDFPPNLLDQLDEKLTLPWLRRRRRRCRSSRTPWRSGWTRAAAPSGRGRSGGGAAGRRSGGGRRTWSGRPRRAPAWENLPHLKFAINICFLQGMDEVWVWASPVDSGDDRSIEMCSLQSAKRKWTSCCFFHHLLLGVLKFSGRLKISWSTYSKTLVR